MMIKWIHWFCLGALLLTGCTRPYEDGGSKGSDRSGDGIKTVIDEYDAIVTVKKTSGGTVYFQVGPTTRVIPLDYDETFSGIKRLACHLLIYEDMTAENWRQASVSWWENLEKGGVVSSESRNIPQNSGLDVLDDWLTSVEDGFFTLHYSAWWGDNNIPHRVTLSRSDNPFEFLLLHENNNDKALHKADALIYFDLNDMLPQTEGQELTIKWITCDGTPAQKSFWYCSRTE